MDQAIKILEQEVEWHKNNKNLAKNKSTDWINGFNEGLQSCLNILITIKAKEDLWSI